jgi:hypothetical protein
MWYRCQDATDGTHIYVNEHGETITEGGTTGAYLVTFCGQDLSGSTYSTTAEVNIAIDKIASLGGTFDLASE